MVWGTYLDVYNMLRVDEANGYCTGRVAARGGGGVQQHISRGKSREATSCTSGGEEFQFKNRQCLDIDRGEG